MRGKQLLSVAVLLHLLAKRLPGVRADDATALPLAAAAAVPFAEPGLRVPSAATTMAMVFNDGRLQPTWSSWSWGLTYINYNDSSAPAPGSAGSLCFEVQPFGALSLRTTQPFAVDGAVLGMHVRGNASAPGGAAARQQQLAGLEVQLETGQNGEYRVSRSATLRELLTQQAAEDGSDPDSQLQAMASGSWVPVRMRLADVVAGGGGLRYDRITIGSCLQNMDGCDGEQHVALCLDHLVLVAAA